MKLSSKKAMTLFVATLLIISSLSISLNLFTSAQPSDDLTYLHGPSLAPVHMNSNITLTPIHMHAKFSYMEYIFEPLQTAWHELYPTYCLNWLLTSWVDHDSDGKLSPNDQIDMIDEHGEMEWYHIDRMTVTLNLSRQVEQSIERMFIELKLPPDWTPYYPPMGTRWHEVWPVYCNIFDCIGWIDNGNQRVDFCDFIDLVDINTGIVTTWHVDGVNNDLILRWKMMDPMETWWHEIHPEFCTWRQVTSWEDLGAPFGQLSPGDQIDMVDDYSVKTWYFVDRVTVTLNVSFGDPMQWMKIEMKTYFFEEMYNAFKHPMGTRWHEVYPDYCNVYNVSLWDPLNPMLDNCNGVLDYCDHLWLQNLTASEPYPEFLCHVEDITYDLILNKKVVDPVSTTWHELYPHYCNSYHVDAWEDNQDGLLSPCDYIDMTLLPTGDTGTYHVENMSVTVKLLSLDEPGYIMYVEALSPFKDMYWPKINPYGYMWHEVWPVFCNEYHVVIWEDNCNGVLDYCDNIIMQDAMQIMTRWHVEEVSVDMVVEEQAGPTPPPPLYWKKGYPDYVPSGVPDFDQRQWLTYNWTDPWGGWSHCIPTAVANSLWWLDSEFETNTIPPPTAIDNFPLVSSYATMLPFWDDHDPQNVQPFIEHLAYLMDTDGRRTGIAHSGTSVTDGQTGLAQYLSWTGVNPKGDCNGDGIVDIKDQWIVGNASGMAADIWPATTGWPSRTAADNIVDMRDVGLVAANMGKKGQFYERTIDAPSFELIESEVEKCEDVVLILGYWFYDGISQMWYREGDPTNHAVTVAGVNSTTFRIALSDPIFDAFELGLTSEGRSPVAHIHNPPQPPYTTHNNASLVSHDIYNVTWLTPPLLPPCPGGNWTIINYPGAPQGFLTVIENAIITSPLGVHDVAVTDVRPKTPGKTKAYQGFDFKINVTVQNQGNFTETFNVTAYANATAVGKQQVTLTSGQTTTLLFIWSVPSNFTKGRYVLSAIADTVKDELDTLDNTFIDGTIRVNMQGDINGDGTVDIFDIVIVAAAFGSSIGDPNYQADADLNCDGMVDIFDIVIVAAMFGQSDP